MEKEELLKKVYEVAHLEGEFHLRSGVVSDEYFDKYAFECQPDLLKEIAVRLNDLLPSDVDLIAGLELGGVPIAVMLSQVRGLPTVFVRKEAKEYGTARLAEGAGIKGKRLVVVEDVITSGGQVIESVGELRERGAVIETVLCVIDREGGGRDALSRIGLEMRSLFKMSDFNKFK